MPGSEMLPALMAYVPTILPGSLVKAVAGLSPLSQGAGRCAPTKE